MYANVPQDNDSEKAVVVSGFWLGLGLKKIPTWTILLYH